MRNLFDKRWLMIALALVAALSLLVAACGGDDDDDSGGDEVTATATEEGGGDETATEEATEEPTDEGDGDGDGAGSLADLEELTSAYENFEGAVTYQVTDFSIEGGLQEMGIAQKGDKSRIDITSADGSISVISTPDASYVCTEGQCLKYPADEDALGQTTSAFSSFLSADAIESQVGDIPEGVEISTSQETIAGLDATCFNFSGDADPDTAGEESGSYCFSEGGILLRLQWESGELSGSFEATEAASDVPDSTFEPPFPVTDLSNLGQ